MARREPGEEIERRDRVDAAREPERHPGAARHMLDKAAPNPLEKVTLRSLP
jgi:hypothetical protein